MRHVTSALVITVLSGVLMGLGGKKHSSVEATFSFLKEKPNTVDVTVQVKPHEALAANFNGPWMLEIKEAGSMVLPQNKWTRADLNESLPGFQWQATVPSGESSGKLTYRLVSFICTADKKVCYRDVHKGDLSWQRDS